MQGTKIPKVKKTAARTPLYRLRKRLKINLSELADLAGVRWPTAQSWDLGKTGPSARKALVLIDRIKKQKGVTVELSDLVGRA